MTELSVTLTQVKQVLGISIALGTALVYGEVRIRLMENHKDVYEPIVQNTAKVVIEHDKKLAVHDVEIKAKNEIARIANTGLEW